MDKSSRRSRTHLVQGSDLQGFGLSVDRAERRLAAVLAADVAGYSRLMGVDEEGTLFRLKEIRKTLIDPAIAAHRGGIELHPVRLTPA